MGANKRRSTQYRQLHNSPKVQPLFTVETEVYRVTEVSRCTQQGEIPHTEALSQLLGAFKQLIHSIENLALDNLGLVTMLVGRNIPMDGRYTKNTFVKSLHPRILSTVLSW